MKKRIDSHATFALVSDDLIIPDYTKQVIVYAIAVVAFCIVIACIPLTGFSMFGWRYEVVLLQLLGFLAAGVYNTWFLSYRNDAWFKQDKEAAMKHTVIISMAILLATALFFLLVGSRQFSTSILAAIVFVLPMLSTLAYRSYIDIPAPAYDLWFKKNNLLEDKAIVFLNSIPVYFKLKTTAIDERYTRFKSTVPAQMEVEKIFHYFLVQQQNNEVVIDTEDEFGDAVGWRFSVQKMWGLTSKTINPALNLRENKVKNYSTIVATRYVNAERPQHALRHKTNYLA